MSTTSATAQGARSYQEDRIVVMDTKLMRKNLRILAVFDGHGGHQVAELCQKIFPAGFIRAFGESPNNIEECLCKTFELLVEETKQMRQGSTASIAVVDIDEMKVYVGILGDSPVVVKEKSGTTIVSPEHNVRTNTFERERAVKRGGFYLDGYIWNKEGKGLQVSRALGDSHLDPILVREPEVYTVELGPESFIIVASDGVFDPKHRTTFEQEHRLAEKVKEGWEAQDLVNDALERQTGDNVTAIVWRAKQQM